MSIPTSTRPYHLAQGEGPALWHLGALATFKATSETTGGQMWVQEQLGERGFASPMHRHSREDEAFYVLDGEIAFHVGGDVLGTGPGSFLWAPRGLAHAFCVESDRARFLVFSGTGGLDRFFFATGEPAAALTVPPPAEAPPDIAALVAVAAGYGVEVVGPPPVPRGSVRRDPQNRIA